MRANKLRKLKPGHQYNRLITPSLGGYIVHRQDADTEDTLKLIKAVIKKTVSQTEKLAPTLKGATLRDTCQNIWNFVYQHIQYALDRPGHEEIRHPARIWADRVTGVDCDDYSVFISSILSNLGIPHKLRITDYGSGKGWQHIYVVVPKDGNAKAALDQKNRSSYITIDDVTDQFDYEVPYHKNYDSAMTLNELNGLPSRRARRQAINIRSYAVDGLGQTDPEMGSIFTKIGGAVKKAAQGVAKVAKNVGQAVKKAATTPVRLGILAWLRFNIKKGASRLRWGYIPYGPAVAAAGYGPQNHEIIKQNLKKLIHTWLGLGGDHQVLRRTIIDGAGNKDKAVDPALAEKADPQEGFHGLGYLSGDVSTDPDWQALMQIKTLSGPLPNVAGLEGLHGDGLGVAPVAAAAVLAAATPIVVPLLNALSKAKTNDPNDPIPDEYQPADDSSGDDDPAATAQAADDASDEATDPADPNSVNGLGAVAKKKKAASKIKAVVTRTAAAGKKITPKQAVAVKKVVKVSPKVAPIVHKALPVATSTMSLPTSLPGVDDQGNIHAVPAVMPTKKAVKAAKKVVAKSTKKPGLLKKAATAVKNVVAKTKAKAKVKDNAKKIKAAKASGNHAKVKQLQKESAEVVKQAQTDSVDFDTNDTTDTTVTPTVSSPTRKKSKLATAATAVMDRVSQAVDNGTITVEKGKKIINKAKKAVAISTGKPTTPTTDSTVDTGYDDHTVVDDSTPATTNASDATVDDGSGSGNDTPTSTGLSTGAMIGLGAGALLLGTMLFGSKSAAPGRTYVRTASAPRSRALSGTPKRKKSATRSKKSASQNGGSRNAGSRKRRRSSLSGFGKVALSD